jgi:hypothetical protein
VLYTRHVPIYWVHLQRMDCNDRRMASNFFSRFVDWPHDIDAKSDASLQSNRNEARNAAEVSSAGVNPSERTFVRGFESRALRSETAASVFSASARYALMRAAAAPSGAPHVRAPVRSSAAPYRCSSSPGRGRPARQRQARWH